MSQLSYPINLAKGNPGQRADNGDVDVLTFLHALIPQITTVTVGGSATAGNYDITIDGVLTRFVRVAEANAAIAQGLVDAINAEPTLANVVSAAINGLDVVITGLESGNPFTVAVAAPGPGTLTPVLTQDADSVLDLPVAIFVKRATGTERNAVLLTGADAVVDVVGLVERPIGQFENTAQGGPDDTTDDTFPPGTTIPVGRRGRWLVPVEEDVTPDSTPFIRFTAGAGEQAGALRASADGGDALDASSILRFLDITPANGFATVELRIS